MLLIGFMLILYGGCTVLAKVLFARGRIAASVAWVCGGLLAPSLVILVAQPALLPTLVLVPVMAVAIGLPYVSERAKLPVLAISVLWMVVLVILGQVLPPHAGPSASYWKTFIVASTATTAIMTLLLLVQYRARLIAALDRERQAAERLRELDRLKSTLLIAASHDLRTPTTAIVGAAKILETAAIGGEDARALATLITRAGDKLSRLLDDLLDVEEIQGGDVRLSVEPRDLSMVVREGLDAIDLPLEPRLVVDLEPATVPIDSTKVARVVDNLVLNALRHAAGAETVWLRVRATDGGAELIVQDDGPGVALDERESIFAPFRRGDTDAPGSGLGLSIVAGFAELHGGRAWVEERPGGGASFHAFFPGDRGAVGRQQPDVAHLREVLPHRDVPATA